MTTPAVLLSSGLLANPRVNLTVLAIIGAVVLIATVVAIRSADRQGRLKHRTRVEELVADLPRTTAAFHAAHRDARELSTPLADELFFERLTQLETALAQARTFLDTHPRLVDGSAALREYSRNSLAIQHAHTTLQTAQRAVEDIARFQRFADGDPEVRRAALTDIVEDAFAATKLVGKTDPDIAAGLIQVRADLQPLLDDPQAPDFTQRYIEIIYGYGAVTELIAQRLFKILHHTPVPKPPLAVGCPEWQPGYDFGHFTPFKAVHHWGLLAANKARNNFQETSLNIYAEPHSTTP